MADGFFSDEVFDWEDDDDDFEIEITTDDADELCTLSQEEVDEIDEAWTLHRQRQINSFVKAAFKNDGVSAMTDLLIAIEHQTNWRVEIIADKGGLESMTFHMYDAFEPELWEHFINSDDYREMVYDITNVSNRKAQIFVEKYLGIRTTLRSRILYALRKIASIFE